jgi:GTPase SAR1 family protein
MENKFTLKAHKLTNQIVPVDHQVKRNDSPIGKENYVVWLFIGAKGSGKTTLMVNLLKSKDAFKGWFDNVFIVSPTAGKDTKLDSIIEELEEGDKYYKECSDENIEEIMSKLRSFNESFDYEDEKRQPANLIILDDCAHSLAKSNQKSPLNELITTCRHLKTSVWIMSQQFHKINPLIRANVDLLSLFKTNNKKEYKAIEEDFNVDPDVFKRVYDFATDSAPNSFLHIKFLGGQPVFYRKFDQIIL